MGPLHGRSTPIVALAVATVALSACGGDDSDPASRDGDAGATSARTAPTGPPIDARTSPETILADAAHALVRARSVHVSLRDVSADGSLGLEADIGPDGGARVSIGEGPQAVRLVKTGSSAIYINADAAFWRATSRKDGSAAAQRLGGRWVKTRPGQVEELDDAFSQLNLNHVASCLGVGTGTVRRSGTATIDGRRAFVLSDLGDRPGTTPGRLYVAADGDPVPLRIVQTGRRRPGGRIDPSCDDQDDPSTSSTTTLDRYDEPLTVTAPPDAIDLGDPTGGEAGTT